MVQEKYNKIIAEPPKSLELQLTYCCNLRCKMCGQWGPKGIFKKNIVSLKKQEISTKTWKNIIDQTAKWKSRINIWGGEPLLRKDIFEIIKYIKSKRLKCSVVTNGILIEKYYKEIIESKLDKIFLSIDGTKEIHDKIRGIKGTFEKISRGIDKLQNLKKKKNLKRPSIEVLFTISKYNYKIIDKMPYVGKTLNADKLDLALLMFTTGKTDGSKLAENILKLLNKKHNCNIKTIDGYKNMSFKKWYETSEETFGFNKCLSPWMRFNIMPDGKANFCIDFPDYIIGDAKKESLSEIWNGKNAGTFREKYLKEGPLPICNRCCWLYNDYNRLLKEWKQEG